MSIPGKLLIAALAAVAASFVVSFGTDTAALPLLLSSLLAAVTAVLASHRPLPPPKLLQSGTSAAVSGVQANQGKADDSAREDGTVKWFNASKGFGFIIRPGGEEIFVHHRSIRGSGRRALNDGQRVRYRVAATGKGPQAEDVEALD
jgi:CspA family cold shock protein